MTNKANNTPTTATTAKATPDATPAKATPTQDKAKADTPATPSKVDLGTKDANGVYTSRPADPATLDARLRAETGGTKADGSRGYRTCTPKDIARAIGRNPDAKGVTKGVRDVLRSTFGTLDKAPAVVGGGTANWRFHPAETPETWNTMVDAFASKGKAKAETTGKAGTATETPAFR